MQNISTLNPELGDKIRVQSRATLVIIQLFGGWGHNPGSKSRYSPSSSTRGVSGAQPGFQVEMSIPRKLIRHQPGMTRDTAGIHVEQEKGNRASIQAGIKHQKGLTFRSI